MGEATNESNSNRIIGNYILGDIIGEGGFGKVYKAQHMNMNRQVCIKVVQPDHLGEDLEDALRSEAQVLNVLDHKNIVRVHDLTIQNNQIYMCIDYVDGGDLAATLRNSPELLSLDKIDNIVEQIADGLHYAHQRHVIHRDLKPHNILLYQDGRAVIADFGLAKVVDTALTQSSQSRLSGAGTWAYMAPEQFTGHADYCSDLYSLGIIVYQLLTRQLPFGAGEQARDGHFNKVPPSFIDLDVKLSPEIEQVVFKMLAKKPAERYQSPIEFARALHSAITKKVFNVPDIHPGNIDKFLSIFPDDQIVSLDPGEYRGPFAINKRIRLIGAGPLTKIFAVNEPVFHIQTSGVCLENMVIQRTPENPGEPAIQVDDNLLYELRHVTILGQLSEGAQWDDAEWLLPVEGIDLGSVLIDSKQCREVKIEVKEVCTVETDMPELAVFPLRLSPGPHTLSLEYNASDKLPGTILSGKIILRSETENKIIAVTGQIEQIAVVPLPESGPDLIPMESSYVFQDKAAQTLLRELGNNEDKDFLKRSLIDRSWHLRKEIIERASELFFELVGKKACVWYIKRSQINKDNVEEELWEFTLATDSSNALEIFTTRKRTLRLFCKVHREGRRKPIITDMHFLKIEMGVKNLSSLTVLLRLSSGVQEGIPENLIAQIQDMPIESPRELDGDQVQGWEALLQFQIDQFKKQQYWAGYSRHNYREGASKVTFWLDKEDLKDSTREPLSYQEFQERIRKTRKELHMLFKELPDAAPTKKGARGSKGLKVGVLEHFHTENATMTINLDAGIIGSLKNNGENLPATGYLHFDAYGDVQQIERQQGVMTDLQQGKALNPLLSDFFFDAKKARSLPVTKHLQAADLLSGTCNNGQIAAIEAALTTPDLLLIQGPPGTGKTTVIAEICYQVAQRGGRTLIASQSNLAVDNALGRIIHRPSIRALRKGNVDSVEDEGRDFTEDRVVQRWLDNTANDCQTKLDKRQSNITLFKAFLSDTLQFSHYYSYEVQWAKDQRFFQRRIDEVVENINNIEVEIEQSLVEEKKYALIQNTLTAIVAGTVNWNKPGFDNILKESYHYIIETGNKQRFRKNINECLRLIESFGLTFPVDHHLLRGVVWLKERVHTYASAWAESQQYIGQIEALLIGLSTTDDKIKRIELKMQENKTHIAQIILQINSYKNKLESLKTHINTLQRATTSYQDIKGRIAFIFHEFVDTYLQYLSATSHSNSRLDLTQIFPEEIMAIIKQDATAAFLKEWYPIRQVINDQIQHILKSHVAYKQVSERIPSCRQKFAQLLSAHPEIRQKLEHTGYGSYASIVVDVSGFSQLINQIENNLQAIHEMNSKGPSFFDIFVRDHDKQRLLQSFLDTRDLLAAAATNEKSILIQMTSSGTQIADKAGASFFDLFKKWIAEQQRGTRETYGSTLQVQSQLESELKRVQQTLKNEEDELSLLLKTSKEQEEKLAAYFQALSSRVDLPQKLRQIAQEHTHAQAEFRSFTQNYGMFYQDWIEDTQNLVTYVAELWNDITVAAEKMQMQFTRIHTAFEQQATALKNLHVREDTLRQALGKGTADLQSQRTWWSHLWETIPKNLCPLVPEDGIYSLSFLETVEKQFDVWRKELAKEENYAQRYDRLITDWIVRLRNLSESDRQELKSAYLKNANVVGITCGQVHKLSTRDNRDISKFEVVIIDEVSKATPPEILLPAIKGKKLILIGDQRQLPPMIEDKTLDQLAEENGLDPLAYRYLRRSYFEQRYGEASDDIKRMLYIQYRMHPDIMAAINQFYDRPLECGLNQADIQRNHQLESALIRKNKHLIWVSTPLASSHLSNSRSRMIGVRNRMSGQSVFSYQSAYNSFEEESSGTSQVNWREIEIITKICEELQQLWTPKVAARAEPKEIGIITFYGAQTAQLQKALGVGRDGKSIFDALNIRVGTVDRFQGIERAIVIVSMVRNNLRGEIGFAKKDERINVAFSRAQELLIIVGCHDLFCGTAHQEVAVERYSNVAKVVRNRGDFIDISSI